MMECKIVEHGAFNDAVMKCQTVEYAKFFRKLKQKIQP